MACFLCVVQQPSLTAGNRHLSPSDKKKEHVSILAPVFFGGGVRVLKGVVGAYIHNNHTFTTQCHDLRCRTDIVLPLKSLSTLLGLMLGHPVTVVCVDLGYVRTTHLPDGHELF